MGWKNAEFPQITFGLHECVTPLSEGGQSFLPFVGSLSLYPQVVGCSVKNEENQCIVRVPLCPDFSIVDKENVTEVLSSYSADPAPGRRCCILGTDLTGLADVLIFVVDFFRQG